MYIGFVSYENKKIVRTLRTKFAIYGSAILLLYYYITKSVALFDSHSPLMAYLSLTCNMFEI